jgi:hypothetical protein
VLNNRSEPPFEERLSYPVLAAFRKGLSDYDQPLDGDGVSFKNEMTPVGVSFLLESYESEKAVAIAEE